jgi:hypothetical protein
VPVPDPPDLARAVRRLAEHGYGSTLRSIEGDWPEVSDERAHRRGDRDESPRR